MANGAGLVAAARTDPGRQREGNEDAVLVAGSLLAVADGMGGHEGGEIASAIAVGALAALGPDPVAVDVRGALEEANRTILARAPIADGAPGMGTTCTAIVVRDGVAHVVHIGDSRAYLLRDGELRQLTEDHALVAQMVRAGLLTPEQASHDERRHVILRALGASADPEIDTLDVPLHAGDRLLLCSDGLHGVVGDDDLRDMLGQEVDPDAVALELVALANRAGGPDNITVVVADYGRAAAGSAAGAALGDARTTIAEGPRSPAPVAVRSGRRGRSRRSAVVVLVTLALLAIAAAIIIPRLPVAAPAAPGSPALPAVSPSSTAPAPARPSPASPGPASPSPASPGHSAPAVAPAPAEPAVSEVPFPG